MSRQYKVPILLPADPLGPMEAATKQYVDNRPAPVGLDEVFIGPDDPGTDYELWVDTDATAGAAPPTIAAIFEQATYTPVIVIAINIGTGALARNEARYVYVGGAAVGDYGVLSASGIIQLGTGGSIGGGPRIRLPSGFRFATSQDPGPIHRAFDLGQVRCRTSAGTLTAYGIIGVMTNIDMVFYLLTSDAAYPKQASISATVPQTWATGDVIEWSMTVPVVRV
jgi:hypothetical protein